MNVEYLQIRKTNSFFPVPPHKPVILWRGSKVSPGVGVGPYEVGDTLVVTCEVSGGWKDCTQTTFGSFFSSFSVSLSPILNLFYPQSNYKRLDSWMDLESQSSFDLISGSPAPSVIWWKEGSVYDDTYELLSSKEKTVTNTLRYSKLSRDDAAAKFTCQASNTKQTPPIATDTHVTLNRK